MKPITLSFLLAAIVLSAASSPALAQEAKPEFPVAAGTDFHFYGMLYVSGQIEFRDATGALFPNYWFERRGGVVSGKWTADPQNPKLTFSLTCHSLAQPGDSLDLKILSEVMPTADNKPPAVGFDITRLVSTNPPEMNQQKRWTQSATVEGILRVGDKPVKVPAGLMRITYILDAHAMRGAHMSHAAESSLIMTIDFTVKGRDLGLTKTADRDVNVRVTSRAFSEQNLLKNTKKQSLSELGIK